MAKLLGIGAVLVGQNAQAGRWKVNERIANVEDAGAMEGDREKCLAGGMDDYMAKPLDVDKLLSLVRVWMPR